MTDIQPAGFEGSPVELYRRLRDVGESQLVHTAVGDGVSILELGCGTGRMTGPLLELGYEVTAVDQDAAMLSLVPPKAVRIHDDIESLARPDRFDVVLLASNLINNTSAATRSGLLHTCRRHVADNGVVVIQRYAPALLGWEPGDWEDRGGVEIRIARYERVGQCFSASVEYRDPGQKWAQHFSAVVLDDEAMQAELSREALHFEKVLDAEGAWVLARPLPRI